VTVPEETVWLAEVELVKVANVPRPAMLAAAPSTATDASNFRVGDQPPFRRPRAVVPLISMNLLCRCLGRLAELIAHRRPHRSAQEEEKTTPEA
jgi:hypothetical protein